MCAPVLLVGFMGSGKSQTGKQLARRLGWTWLDLDALIVQKAGETIPEIFSRRGEAVFRHLERQCLLHVIDRPETVVSCGGGIVVRPENLEDLLKQPRVVCLRITPETVFRRVGNDPRRPLLQGPNPLEKIRELMREREAYYARFPYQIDVDHLRSYQVAEMIIRDFRLKGLLT